MKQQSPIPQDTINGQQRFKFPHMYETPYRAEKCLGMMLLNIVMLYLIIDVLNGGDWSKPLSILILFPFLIMVSLISIYRLIKGSVPEQIILNKPNLTFDSGIPPLWVGNYVDSNNQNKKQIFTIFYSRKRYEFSNEQIQTLQLSEKNYGNRLTILKGRKRIDLATNATDAQREWLNSYIKKHY